MSLRLEMLQVARLAPRLLGESADLITQFLNSRHNADGGFKDRAGRSDLYYTVFGIQGLFALGAELPTRQLENYLRAFGDGEALDFVHLACLVRCWAMLGPERLTDSLRIAILERLESFRSTDGGYHASVTAKTGTVYGCFLATSAYQDFRSDVPNPQGIIHCIQSLKATDGGYANQHDLPMGLTPSTAAAVTLLRQFDEPIDASLGDWLMSRSHPQGGFFATPVAPIPDLLSTATALHALAGIHRELGEIKENTLDFIDTLWSSEGAFFGNWEDGLLDCEYTYYGLLALGHLSVA